MFTVITMFRNAGFNISCWDKYDKALDTAMRQTQANAATSAVIYNAAGELIWRRFADLRSDAPVATAWTVRDSSGTVLLTCDSENQVREVAKQLAHKNGVSFFAYNPLGALIFEAIHNPRSIFSDVDTAGNRAPDAPPQGAYTQAPEESANYAERNHLPQDAPSAPEPYTSSSDSGSSGGGD